MRKLRRGLVQVYTGEGKGKTTASLGLACRARGYKKNVAYVYFHKNPLKHCYGEYNSLKKLDIDVFIAAKDHPSMTKEMTKSKARRDCLKGLEIVKKIYREDKYDLLVLDEINICLRDGFLKKQEVLGIIDKKPRNLELVLTGRSATQDIIKRADLASEIINLKHPYDNGITARKCIDY